MQTLRNCSGKGNPGKNQINGFYYPRCPKATYLENEALKTIVKIFFDCKESKTWPHPGGMLHQTVWCIRVFDILDDKYTNHINKKEEEQTRKMKKLNKPKGTSSPAGTRGR